MAENTGLRSLIIDPTQVDPQVDVTGLRTATDTSPQLLAQAPDFQGVQFDPTSYDYLSDLYELYSGGLPMLDTPATTDPAQIPGAVDTLVNVGSQGQVQGTSDIQDSDIQDIISPPDTTFQDAGATDMPGTIGNLGDLAKETTVTIPNVNPIDEFDTPITVTVPALDLSGTSTDLIDRGVIETPQEFYGRTYNTSPSDYGLLDQEEKNLVDQQYANAYSLAPVPEPTTTLKDIINLSPTVQIGKAAINLLTPDESVSSTMAIDPDTGLFAAGDPFVDAQENEFGNIQDTPPTVTTVDPISTALTLGEGQTFDDIGEIDTVGEQLGAGDDLGVNQADVEAGLATESISDFTPSPEPMFDDPFQDDGGSDDSDTFGGSEDQGEIGSDAGFAAQEQNIQENPFDTAEGSGGSSGGGKIVCTMMNKTYGFGSFRNKIWLRQSKDLAPEYQKGYHILFLPLVKVAETNKIIRKILEHIAVHRTIDIRQESRGKTHMLGRIYRKILEPICYWVGKNAKR